MTNQGVTSLNQSRAIQRDRLREVDKIVITPATASANSSNQYRRASRKALTGNLFRNPAGRCRRKKSLR